MPGENPQVVRQHERLTCRMPVTLKPVSDAGGQVVLSRTAADGDGSASGVLLDCSRGGLGLESPVYVPRGAIVRVSMARPGTGTVEITGCVQRSMMRDRTPRYYLGLSYAGVEGAEIPRIEAVMAIARDSGVEGKGA